MGNSPDCKGTLSSSILISVSKPGSITHLERCHIPWTFIRQSKLILTHQPRSALSKTRLSLGRCDWLQMFPFQQFYVLFNSLSKVLFIFPSQYLFTISLLPIFSFRCNLPLMLSCIPKQLNSSRAHHKSIGSPCQRQDSHPLRCSLPEDLYKVRHGKCFSRLQLRRPQDCQILNLSFSRFTCSY